MDTITETQPPFSDQRRGNDHEKTESGYKDQHLVIEKAQQNLRMLLHFATVDAPIPVKLDPALVENAVKVTHCNPSEITGQLEAKLWTSLNELATLVYPSTMEGIDLVQSLNKDCEKRPSLIRKWWEDISIRKQLSWARWIQFLLTITLIFVQTYVLGINIYILRFDNTYRERNDRWNNITQGIRVKYLKLAELYEQHQRDSISRLLANSSTDLAQEAFKDEMGQEHETIASALGEIFTSSFFNDPDLNTIQMRLTQDYKDFNIFTLKIFDRDNIVESIDDYFRKIPKSKTPESADQSSSAENLVVIVEKMEGSVSAARSLIRAIGFYVLPTIYGLLGASAYVLRRLNEQIKSYTLSVLSLHRYRLRMAMGGLLGFAIGLFISPQGLQVPVQWSIPLVGIAFLAGYSIEFVFSFLDAIVRALNSTVNRTPEDLSMHQSDTLKPPKAAPLKPNEEFAKAGEKL